MSEDFTKDEQSDISFTSNMYDFSVDCQKRSVKLEDILNVHKYLMIKNIIT